MMRVMIGSAEEGGWLSIQQGRFHLHRHEPILSLSLVSVLSLYTYSTSDLLYYLIHSKYSYTKKLNVPGHSVCPLVRHLAVTHDNHSNSRLFRSCRSHTMMVKARATNRITSSHRPISPIIKSWRTCTTSYRRRHVSTSRNGKARNESSLFLLWQKKKVLLSTPSNHPHLNNNKSSLVTRRANVTRRSPNSSRYKRSKCQPFGGP